MNAQKPPPSKGRPVYVFVVEDNGLEPFKPTLESIVRMAFTAGLQALASRGLTMAAIKTDSSARSRFLRGCHRGYDKAQQRIGTEVIAMHQQISMAEAELVRLRQERDPGRARLHKRIVVLRNRELALRRLIDSLLVIITNFQTWILRRFLLEDRIYDVDPEVLRRTLAVASRRNEETRLRFSLVSDLSTVVQIGDLVEISFESNDRRWTVIELKEGRMNELLTGMLDKHQGDTEEVEKQIDEKLGIGAVKQARRMQKQAHRLAELQRIIATDQGTDPRTGTPIFMTPDHLIMENYADAIRRVIVGAKKKGMAGASIPGGLHLIGLHKDKAVGDFIGALNHTFFHMRYPERVCRLADGKDQAIEELREMEDGTVFVDLVAHSMHAQWGTPVYLWVQPEEAPDLVAGEVRVFAQFHVEAFFALALREGTKVSWVTGKEAEKLKQAKLSRPIPGSPNAWGIHAVLPDGTDQTFVAGFVARVIADLTTPRELLNLIKQNPEQMRKAGLDPAEFTSP